MNLRRIILYARLGAPIPWRALALGLELHARAGQAHLHRTIQIGLERLKTGDVDKLNLVTAGTVIAALPIFLVLIAFQRQLVRGLTAGAVKG